ncbi:MAG: prepilin-type N-terminal cleavage/methylation domain-containing protein [Planctomycetota bacterium]
MSRRGFTLLEVMIALGIFAVGATAAFAVLVAAASAERRASHQIHAALIADAVFSEVQGDLAPGLTLQDLVDKAGPDGGQSQGSTVWVIRDRQHAVYPDYRYDVALTPVPCQDPDAAWTWLVEVDVRWSDRGQGRTANFKTVLVSQLTYFDNPEPVEGPGRSGRVR